MASYDENLPHLKRQRLGRPAASEYLRHAHGVEIKPTTLAKLASTGGGPKFYKFGRSVLYDRDFLDDWVRSRLQLKSNTSG